mgnify:CR=1 FL=1
MYNNKPEKIDYIVEFKNKDDTDWFENNIAYPEGSNEKSPVKHVIKISEESKEFARAFLITHTHSKSKTKIG